MPVLGAENGDAEIFELPRDTLDISRVHLIGSGNGKAAPFPLREVALHVDDYDTPCARHISTLTTRVEIRQRT